MIRTFGILIFSVYFLSCNSTQKKSETVAASRQKWMDIVEVDRDTLPNGKRLLDNIDSSMTMYYKEVVGSDSLKGDYVTCYGIDDSSKYFYLRHGDSLQLLAQTPIYTSTWSLGTLEKDFDNFFITRVDNGNGVPGTYRVFDKKTGQNILGDNVEAWSFKYFKDTLFFLYDNHRVTLIGNHIDRKKADSIFLYNIKSGKYQGFKLPLENPTDIIYYDLKTISKNRLVISREEHFEGKEKLIRYSR